MLNKKKIIILVSILAGLFVILLAAYIYIDKVEDKKDYEKNLGSMVTNIYNFDSFNTDTMTLTNPDGVFSFKYIQDSDTWETLSTPREIKHSDYVLKSVAYALSELQSIGTITEKAEDLSLYGLDNPSKVELKTLDGKSYNIAIGSQSFGNDFYYAMKPNTKIVYKISVNDGQKLSTSENKILNTYIIDASFNDINFVNVEINGETAYEIVYENDKYSVTKPIKWDVDYTEVQNLVNGVVRSQATEVIAEGADKFEEYGFDTPFAVLKVGVTDGQEKTVYFTDFNEVTETIYAFMDDRVLNFTGDSIFYLGYNVLAFMDTAVYVEGAMRDVELMTVEYDGYVTDMTITPNAEIDKNLDLVWKYKKTEDENFTEIPISTLDNQQLMNQFFAAVLSPTVSSVDVKAVPEGESFLKITLKRKIEPHTVTIEYLQKDETTFYVMKNGEYAGVITRYNDFETANMLIPTWQLLFDAGLLS